MDKERMILRDLAEIVLEEIAPIMVQMAAIHLRLASGRWATWGSATPEGWRPPA